MDTITCPVCKKPVNSPGVFRDIKFDLNDKQEVLNEYTCESNTCGVVFRRIVEGNGTQTSFKK